MSASARRLLMACQPTPFVFNPSLYGTVFAYYNANDASSITQSSGRITQWNDLSGNARHLTSSGSARPFSGRTAGSNNAIDFQGGQYLHHADGSLGYDLSAFTVYVVLGVDSQSDNDGVLSVHNGSGSDWDQANALCAFELSNSSFTMASSLNVAGPKRSGAGVPAAGLWALRLESSSPNEFIMTDPAGSQTTVIDTNVGTANGGILVGARYLSGAIEAATYGLDGYVVMVLLYDGYIGGPNSVAAADAISQAFGL